MIEVVSKGVIDTKTLTGQNFFHYQNLVAFPKVNEFIFRKRMFNMVWKSRFSHLEKIADFVESGKLFSSALTDKELSIQRDYIILFGTKEQQDTLFKLEAKYLPQNQSHNMHDKYALLISLLQEKLKGEQIDEALLAATTKQMESVRQVGPSWVKYELEDLEDGFGTRPFFAATPEDAEAFKTSVREAVKREGNKQEILKTDVGLYALSILESDPLLMAPKSLDLERKLVQRVHTALQVK